MDEEEEELRSTADAIRERKKLIVQAHRTARGSKTAIVPKKVLAKVIEKKDTYS